MEYNNDNGSPKGDKRNPEPWEIVKYDGYTQRVGDRDYIALKGYKSLYDSTYFLPLEVATDILTMDLLIKLGIEVDKNT